MMATSSGGGNWGASPDSDDGDYEEMLTTTPRAIVGSDDTTLFPCSTYSVRRCDIKGHGVRC